MMMKLGALPRHASASSLPPSPSFPPSSSTPSATASLWVRTLFLLGFLVLFYVCVVKPGWSGRVPMDVPSVVSLLPPGAHSTGGNVLGAAGLAANVGRGSFLGRVASGDKEPARVEFLRTHRLRRPTLTPGEGLNETLKEALGPALARQLFPSPTPTSLIGSFAQYEAAAKGDGENTKKTAAEEPYNYDASWVEDEKDWVLLKDARDGGRLKKVKVKDIVDEFEEEARLTAPVMPPSHADKQPRLLVALCYRRSAERWPQVAFTVAYLHRYLPLLKLNYTIVLSEQLPNEKLFNRGFVLNVAFDQFEDEIDFMLVLDVDSVPILYREAPSGKLHFVDLRYPEWEVPTHVASAAEKFGWNQPYKYFVGVANMFRADSYLKLNGFPNNYYGWGREDDDLYFRTLEAFGGFKRAEVMDGMFHSLPHKDSRTNCGNLNWRHNTAWYEDLRAGGHTRMDDGLLQLQYQLLKREYVNAWGGFYWIVADPQMPLLGNQRDRISKTELDICQLGITDEFIAGMQIAAGVSIPILAIIIWLRRRFCRQCLTLRFQSRDL